MSSCMGQNLYKFVKKICFFCIKILSASIIAHVCGGKNKKNYIFNQKVFEKSELWYILNLSQNKWWL